MPLFKRPDSPNWYVSVGDDLKRSTGVPHTPSDDAEECERYEKLAVQFERTLTIQTWQIEKLGDHSSLSFKDAAQAYLALHAGEPDWGAREKDIIGWLLDEPAPSGPQLGRFSIREVADWDALLKFQALCDAQGWAKTQTNRVMAVVSSVLHCNPKWFATRVRIPLHQVKKKERPYIAAERIPDVCVNLQWHSTLAVNFAVVTLLRMRAMLSLRWDDISIGSRWGTVRMEFQKTNRPFGFALTDSHIAMLQQLKEFQQAQWMEHLAVCARRKSQVRTDWDHQHVFTWFGRAIRNCNTRAFQRAVRLAHCPDGFCWHSWRHVGATLARLAGVSLPDLQALGGWESIGSVQRYAHIIPEALAPAAQKLAAMLPSLDQLADMRRQNAKGAQVVVPGGVAFIGGRVAGGVGGAGGDRTRDLVVANDALSQLSYSPTVTLAGVQILPSDLQSRAEKDPEIASLINQLANKLSGESAALRMRPKVKKSRG